MSSYSTKIRQEIDYFKDKTELHELPAIFHYWSNKYLRPKCESLGFSNPNDFYVQYIERAARNRLGDVCRILSIGAGNCDTEVNLAKILVEKGVQNFHFDCLELNPHMLARGRQVAAAHHVSERFGFIETDINHWQTEHTYPIVIASESLHHVVDLETLFDKLHAALDDRGFILTNDMIGRNGHMRWPEALEIVSALWVTLDDRHKWNHQLSRFEAKFDNWDCSKQGFEGIRAQDILPLLIQRFGFECFLGFANLIGVFVDRNFGPNFDPGNPRDRSFIDFVAGLDDHLIELGKLKPTQMIAAIVKDKTVSPKVYKHLTPEFCVREVN